MPRQPLAPAAAANAVADQPGKPSPEATTHVSAAASPKTCDTTSTVRTCSDLDFRPPTKSPSPHERLAPSASAIASTSPTGLVAATASSWLAW